MKEKINNFKADWYSQKDVFLSALIIGFLTHGYMLFNKLPNVDDYVSMFHYGLGYPLGRWFLALMGNFMFRIDGVYSLPYLNGAFFLFTLALSITIFLKPFPFHNKWVKRIFAALFVSFPTVTSTMGFMFTVPFYGLAILLMAIGFYLTVTYRYGFLISILLMCCSLGIYQAYWCLCAAFLLLFLIAACMNPDTKNKDFLVLCLKSFITLLLSVLVYLIINNIMLKLQNITLSDYQGVSQMGAFEFSQIPTILGNAYSWFFRMLYENYLYITWYPVVRIIIGVGYVITFLFFVIACIKNRKNIVKLVALILFTAILPLTINSIYIMCNDASTVHVLMCYSVVLVFFAPFIYLHGVIQNIPNNLFRFTKAGYVCCIVLVTFFYVRLANLYYFDLDLSYRETTGFMTTLSTRIQQTEGYTMDKPVYFHGLYPHASNRNIWELRPVNQMHGTIDVDNVINSPLMRQNFFKVYLGYAFYEITDNNLINGFQDTIAQMPSYPDDGSIQILDDIIVIKLSD